MIGLELCLPLLLGLAQDAVFPLARLVEALTAAPARVVGLPAPRIREGARADLVLVDPRARWTIEPQKLRSKSKNTPFTGREVLGRVTMTMANGIVIFEADGTSRASSERGRNQTEKDS
jgi:dihydroorotase